MSYPPPKNGTSYLYNYINLVQETDILFAFAQNEAVTMTHFEKGNEFLHSSYAPGKWTVAQLYRHILDAERVFAYRALRFCRGDKTELPGFDQDVFAETVHKKPIDTNLLLSEYQSLRSSTIALLKSLDMEDLSRTGIMSGYRASASELFAAMAGHERHHHKIIQERY